MSRFPSLRMRLPTIGLRTNLAIWCDMNSAVYLLFIVFCTVEYHCTKSNAVELDQSLLDAIRYVESGGNVCALGDEGVSLGAYQITQGYYSEALEANTSLIASGEGI